MNKAVPWSVKGVGFDAREAARAAARRAGLPVGEWLDTVITERAVELGVAAEDITPDERLDALVARLAGVAEPGAYDEGRPPYRVESVQRPILGGRAAVADPALAQKRDGDMESGLRSEAMVMGRRVANGSAVTFEEAMPTMGRHAVPGPLGTPGRTATQWATDGGMDDALRLAEQRAVASEGQRLKVAALAREMDRIGTGAPVDPRSDRDFAEHFARQETRAATTTAGARTVRDVADTVTERLEQLEGRLAQRDAELANKPIVSALARLEERFDHLARRNQDGTRDAARVEATFRDLDSRLRDISQKLDRNPAPPAPKPHAEIERMDGQLASMLANADPFAPKRGMSDRLGGGDRPVAADRMGERSPMSDTVAEIARRQADLDGTDGYRSMIMRESSYPSIGQAQRVGAARPPLAAPDAGQHLFADMEAAFATLSARLESRLDQAVGEKDADAFKNNDLKSLKQGIVGIEERLDALQQQTVRDRLDPEVAGNVALLREEIASLTHGLSDLAARQSVDSLDGAVRALAERMDRSRHEGVSDAVLAPIERLNVELRAAIRDCDPRDAIMALDRRLLALGTKVESLDHDGLRAGMLDELQGQAREVRELLRTAATQFPQAGQIEHEFAKLGARVDRLADMPPRAAIRDLELATNEIRTMLVRFSPSGLLEDLSFKLDRIAERLDESEERMALPAALFDDLSRRIDEAHASLAEKIDTKTATVDLRPIEAMLGGLSGKIDGLRHSSNDMIALGGLVRGLAAQIEEARLPDADARILDSLETQVSRLAEKLDRSDASLQAISSLERLVGELFHQLEDTRTATVDAAENAARTAAHETLKAALASAVPSDAGPSLHAAQAADHVSQELAEFRKSQQASEKRVHGTLLALNETLERMVERMVKDARAQTPAAAVVVPQAGSAQVNAATPLLRPVAKAGVPPTAPVKAGLASTLAPDKGQIDPELPVEPAESKGPAALAKPSVPAVEIGRPLAGDATPDVSPLIAAARRAAQAAQASATAGRDGNSKVRAGTVAEKPALKSGLLSLLGQRRRPMLLGLAGVVLLLGALQMVHLTRTGMSDASTGTATIASTESDDTVAELPTPSPTEAASGTTAALTTEPAPVAQPAAPPVVASPAPDKVVTQATDALKPDPSLAGFNAKLRDLATAGDAGAQYEVGARFSEGRGVARDPKAAATWFERAARQNLAPAQYRLGSIYEKGTGVTADPAAAASWYEKAAAQGNIRAMHNLAVMAAEGTGAKPDYAKAATWFGKAAERGVRDSQFNLAILDARGLGIPQNLAQSYTWFAVAATQGDADAGRKRDDVAAKLDAKSLAAAKAAADTFKPLPTDRTANEVTPPPGGWETVATKAGPDGKGKLSSM